MIAHAFTVDALAEMVRRAGDGNIERMIAGGKRIEVVRLRITEAGRRALEGALS
jgi:hypothetical protein